MRLIDADMLSPDRDYYDNSICSGYDAVSCQQIDSAKTVEAIPLEKVKEARGEINRHLPKFPSPKWADTTLVDIKDVYRILDKLIAESED